MGTKDLLFKTFRRLDRAGLHALPKHYYSPVPDCSWLEDNRPLWTGRSSLTGIAWDLPAQFAWLKDVCEPYYSEVAGLGSYRALAESGSGPGFGEIESQVLHCFMRRFAPGQVIEIGSGVSTLCMLEAARLNQGDGKPFSKITCVEPFPNDKLRGRTEIELIPQLCQQVPLTVFDRLSSGDLLFIDSTHAVKIGSDVLRIYLEIIPRLAPGVFIHIHDIYLPYAYPRTVFTRPWWWQETAMLMTLLINNPKLAVLACESALHYDYSEQMQKVLTDYRPAPNNEGLSLSKAGHFPASTWLRTV
jgi:Methyltransferase domain